MENVCNYKSVIGRFAPSPTGRMHLGNVLTALISWLSARSANGRIILRIEDLDPQRSRESYAVTLIDDLSWLGLDWDYGGNIPDYRQSQRKEYYEKYFNVLHQKGLVYPCFCSRNELNAASAPHADDGSAVYSGRCRALPPEEAEKLKAKRPYSYRLIVPDETIFFHDLNYGDREENLSASCGDFILRRSDGVFAYQLAVTVDDALMGVTQVVRGADLLPSSARQIYLYRLFGFTPPVYAHVPLLISPDGKRLSKRDRSLDLGFIRSSGIKPEEVIGRLAFLSGIIDRDEPVSPGELIRHFSWNKMKKESIMLGSTFFI